MDTAARDSIVDDIQEILEGNGNIDPKTKDRMVFTVLGAIYQSNKALEKQVDGLKSCLPEKLTERLVKVEKFIIENSPWIGLIKWAALIAGGAILAVVGGLLVNRIELIFH
jgi:hypothetical protein